MSEWHAQRIEELESVRGLAALLVVCFHIPPWHSLRDMSLINNSYLMVDLFFVLSGFVIFNAWHDRISSARDLLRFQFLRFGRLYPVHLLFLCVFVFIEVAKLLAESGFGLTSPNSAAFRENNLLALLQQLFLFQAIWPAGNADTFNAPAWSISVEFYTYLIFAVVTLLGGRGRNIAFAVLAILALGLLTGASFKSAYLLRGIAGFFIGCLVAVAITHSRGRSWKVDVPSWASTLVLVMLVLFLVLKTDSSRDPFIYLLSSLLLLTLVVQRDGILNRMLRQRFLVWLGTISYSVYMSHLAVIWGVNQFIRLILQRPEAVGADGISVPQLAAWEMLLAIGVVMGAVIMVSVLVYRLVEQPWRVRSREAQWPE
ncbi:MAG: hypothetical protein A3H44_07635 [Gammaproteobacteria bacterium RIFCSPLOWO2_02_FULL_57_10]|nr:MAG: hypothetical protein A3H44_07635 [Gammaproteobacteria bacterium RIFCSPLOWO2_02_FULL_57_10]